LWDLLEINIPGQANAQGMYTPDLVWQSHMPYEVLKDSANELWIFVDEANPSVTEPGRSLSKDSIITAGMKEVLAIVPGAVEAKADSKLNHIPLLRTGTESGLINGSSMRDLMTGGTSFAEVVTGTRPELPIAMAIEGSEKEDGVEKPIKAVYVADADLMLPEFSMIRADPETLTEARFQFQNVTFVLNCIDWLTDETHFIEVRKHEPIFASLQMIDGRKDEARRKVMNESKSYQTEYDTTMREAQESMDRELQKLREEVEGLQKQSVDGKVPRAELNAKLQSFQTKQELEQRKLDVKRTKSELNRAYKISEIERSAAEDVTKIQNQVKVWAVALPCIPPLCVGVIVFASRRLRERENISKSRLK
jgi:ABC-2 type transport system permease protein